MMKEDFIEIKVTKDFKVPAEKVFDAWLNLEMLGRWMFGPEVREEKIVNLENNPHKGGSFSYVVLRDEEELDHRGTYRELDRPHRLVFTWGVNEEAGDDSVVTIEIESTKNGCRLTLVHELAPEWAEYAERTREGWTFMLDKLQGSLAVRL